ncbi:MAG: dihydroorotate dehydrogenase-like protein [Mariniphaga sp.]
MMTNLNVSYLGLDLKNPIIAGSSGLTNSIENLKAIEEAGAGAVVLKSIFEEEIYLEFAHEFRKLGPMDNNLEFLDYYDYQIKKDNLKHYLTLISEAKKVLTIPVIASINCTTAHEWAFFAKKVEDAGADAIELNIFVLPTNLSQTSNDNESMYFDIVSRVSSKINIPISLKISPYFSNLGAVIRDLSFSEVRGLVLFNKFYSPDVDIHDQKIVGSDVLSQSSDYKLSLRWIGMMANRVNSDLSASTGIHDWETVIKMLLVGATTVQLVSILYKDGFSAIPAIIQNISRWMEENGYQSIADFRGKLSLDNTTNLAEFERVQFMRNFGEHK